VKKITAGAAEGERGLKSGYSSWILKLVHCDFS